MDSIQFEINQVLYEIERLDNGFKLFVNREEKLMLLSHEIWLWITGHLNLEDGLQVEADSLEEKLVNNVLQFVGIESTRYL
jgi:hypothetical protein